MTALATIYIRSFGNFSLKFSFVTWSFIDERRRRKTPSQPRSDSWLFSYSLSPFSMIHREYVFPFATKWMGIFSDSDHFMNKKHIPLPILLSLLWIYHHYYYHSINHIQTFVSLFCKHLNHVYIVWIHTHIELKPCHFQLLSWWHEKNQLF